MDEKESGITPDDRGGRGSSAGTPEDYRQSRQRELYSAHDLLYWKVLLYQLLKGERTSEVIQSRGSAADYLKTQFRPAHETIDRHVCIEALNEILNEVSLPRLSPSALNHLLDLIAEFHPRNGFPSIVTCLKLRG